MHSPSRSKAEICGLYETAWLVRYYVLLISNALRWMDDWDMAFKKCRDYNGHYPSGKDFLQILHLKSQGLHQPASLTNIRKFCEYLLEWNGYDWISSLALSRLNWYAIPFPTSFDWVRKKQDICTLDGQYERVHHMSRISHRFVD